MALYQISGIGRRKTKQEKKAKKEEVKRKVVERIKKAGKVTVKYAPPTVAGRNALLLLVKLNAFKLAEKLAQAVKRDPNKIRQFWTKLGGNYDALVKNITRGTKGAFIGTDPVVTPTLIATATPILVALAKLLKDMGISADDLRKFAGGVVNDAIEKKAEKEAEAEAEKETALADQESAPEESMGPEGSTTDTVKKYLPLLAVAGIGAYFLMKKK